MIENSRQLGFQSEKDKKDILSLNEKIQFLTQQLNEKDQMLIMRDDEIRQMNQRISNMERQQTERKVEYENKNNEAHYQLQLMNDEISARDSVLEQNQKQLIQLQQKYDQLHHSFQEMQVRYRQQENEIEEKNEELKYLKLQDQNNRENLLEDEAVNQLTLQVNQLKLTVNQREQDINNLRNKLEENQSQYQQTFQLLEQTNSELENQVGVLKQEISVLRNQPKSHSQQQLQPNVESAELQKELESAQEIVKNQENILKQKESAIQDLILKNGQLKENQIQLEQEMSDFKNAYKKSLKSMKEENEQAKQTLDPLQKENAEMFELLNMANMEIEQLKQKVDEYEGQQHVYKEEKSTTRDQLDKISMENVRVSYELQQQKEYLSQQQQQIKDLTVIIQSLKNDNFMMSQQIKSGMSLMQSNDKLFLSLQEGDKNGSLKIANSQRSNAPLAEKSNRQGNHLHKNFHHETFGQQQLLDMNMGIQNTEEQDAYNLLEADKINEYQIVQLDTQMIPQINAYNQEQVHHKMQQQQHNSPQKSLQKSINKDDKLQSDEKDERELKNNDSEKNLISIKERDESLQKKQNSEFLERQSIHKSPNQSQKQVTKERQRILVNNLMNDDFKELKSNSKLKNHSQEFYETVKSSSKKLDNYYSYQGRIDDQNTPKAPQNRPSFVREIQSPRRKSMKLSQYQSNSKNLAYMSFSQEEYEKNRQQNEQNGNPNQQSQLNELIIEQTSTIQSGSNTIYYSNNNTIEQAENNNYNSQRIDFANTNPLKATPLKDNFKKQQRLDKLQSLSDYLKTQSKNKIFSPMNTGPQAIKIPYNQTADFDMSLNNESKLNTLIQDLNTLDNPSHTDKIKLEDYHDENDQDDESQTEINENQLIIQSPQNIDLIHYAEDDNSQQISPIKQLQSNNKNNNNNIGDYQLIVQKTQMEDFSSKVSNYDDDTQQTDMLKQSQLCYQQIIYPQQPDQYYMQKSLETHKLNSGQVIAYEEEFFNNLKILSIENLTRFKKSCLSDKTLLFENESIKIGVTNHSHVYSGKNFVKLQMYIFNKDLINDIPYFNLRYLMNEDVSVWTKPEKLNGEIKIHKHLKQDLIIDLNCIPFEFLTAHFQLENEGDGGKRVLNEYFLMMPTSLNRFMTFSLINANNFKSKWLINQVNSIKTEEFEYNTKIVKNPYVFLKYFTNTVELNPHRKEEHLAGLQDYKIGGLFQFYHLDNQQFMLKITVKPFNKLQIHISPSNGASFTEDSAKCCHYLLQTFYFLFKYNPLEGLNSQSNIE